MSTLAQANPGRKRPLSLTLTGWFFIVSDAVSLIYLPISANSPVSVDLLAQYRLPPWATLAMGLLVALLCLVSGIGILRRRAWSRPLYVGATIFGTAVGVLNMPMPFLLALIPGVVLFVLFAYLLYRRPASAYFER